MAHGRAVRSAWASGRGKIMPRCVLGGLAVAGSSRGAFPGGNPGQVLRSMHPKSGLGRENRQFAARFARHASENGLTLAGYARHASEKPRKPPFGNAPREDLARKGRFSLHGPLKSCIVRRSCHPASTKHPSARNPCAADQRQTARAPAAPAPPNSTEQHEPPTTTPPSAWQRTTHSIRGASGSHTANAPAPHRPATLRRQADVKSCAARAPQRQSAARGPTAPQRPMAPSGRSIHNGGGATRLDANPDATGATAPTLPAASGARGANARAPHAQISSSLRRGFALFHRRRAPTIHIYPPLL